MESPKYLWRQSDGYRFSLNPDGKYTMDKSEMAEPHRWTLEHLLSTSAFKDEPPVILELNDEELEGGVY